MAELVAPRKPTARAGVAVTYRGGTPNQAVYWEVVYVDPDTGAEWASRGYLKWRRTRTDAAGQSLNYYYAPDEDPGMTVKYDTGRVYDTPGLFYDGNPLVVGNDLIRAKAV